MPNELHGQRVDVLDLGLQERELSRDFGETYGPLAGVIGLLLWALGTALALFFGLAVAAQLEAVRAGSPQPGSDSVEG